MKTLVSAIGQTLVALLLAHLGNRACRADEAILASVAAWSGPVENTQAVALGDIDGDGKLDLVRGNARGASSLYLNNGSVFATTSSWPGPDEGTETIAL